MGRRRSALRRTDASARGLVDGLLESTELALAFDRLSPRWQFVLVQVEVHGMGPSSLADALGLDLQAATALSYRAHEGLRMAYLRQHGQLVEPGCVAHRRNLGAWARHGLHTPERLQVESHLQTCFACSQAATAVIRVATRLGHLTRPADATPLWGICHRLTSVRRPGRPAGTS